jgi:hypothetical protein
MFTTREAPVSGSYAGRQFVGVDLHRRRTMWVPLITAHRTGVADRGGRPGKSHRRNIAKVAAPT